MLMGQTYFAYLALLGLLLSFGLYNPLHYLLYKLMPGYKSFKWTGRFLIITNFALCVLAGYGYASYPSLWWIVIALIDLFWFGNRFLYLRKESDFYPPKEVMEYLNKHPGKILTLSVMRDNTDWEQGKLEFPANATIPLGITNITGYDPMILKTYHQLINDLQGLPTNDFGQCTIKLDNINKKLLDTLEVEYIYAPKGKEFDGFKIVVPGENGNLIRREK